ncbi:TetR/AcrR family transcriptional regulator [Nocardia sp. NBC_01327]|uniref:TetR/AcrR family transcriptional regulator n=1 Tax=Nocardia sp. NBC_01327 TaxID=2903593 RepID=UPI002E11A973|nr:TetR/AcrR family transcriptional regulator [Nocardia sp. NBC_01327]
MSSGDGGMREKIRQVALESFTERGYDGTSLREIAEQLDVTKAALYYHFKSKDAILLSLIVELLDAMGELVTWGRAQPFSPAFQDDMLDRVADLFFGDANRVVRLIQQNQPVLRALAADAASKQVRDAGELKALIGEVITLMTPADCDLHTRMRIRTAVAAIIFGPITGEQLGDTLDASPDEQKKISLAIARELLAI